MTDVPYEADTDDVDAQSLVREFLTNISTKSVTAIGDLLVDADPEPARFGGFLLPTAGDDFMSRTDFVSALQAKLDTTGKAFADPREMIGLAATPTDPSTAVGATAIVEGFTNDPKNPWFRSSACIIASTDPTDPERLQQLFYIENKPEQANAHVLRDRITDFYDNYCAKDVDAVMGQFARDVEVFNWIEAAHTSAGWVDVKSGYEAGIEHHGEIGFFAEDIVVAGNWAACQVGWLTTNQTDPAKDQQLVTREIHVFNFEPDLTFRRAYYYYTTSCSSGDTCVW